MGFLGDLAKAVVKSAIDTYQEEKNTQRVKYDPSREHPVYLEMFEMLVQVWEEMIEEGRSKAERFRINMHGLYVDVQTLPKIREKSEARFLDRKASIRAQKDFLIEIGNTTDEEIDQALMIMAQHSGYEESEYEIAEGLMLTKQH